jgi:hypothetical protein
MRERETHKLKVGERTSVELKTNKTRIDQKVELASLLVHFISNIK